MHYTFGSIRSLLLEKNKITKEELEEAEKKAEEKKKRLIDVLEEELIITEEELMELISEHTGIPYTRLETDMINPEAVKIISEDIVRRYKVFPILLVANILTVAMSDPQDLFTLDNLKSLTNHPINPILCSEKDIYKCIHHFYGEQVVLEAEKTAHEKVKITKKAEFSLDLTPEDMEKDDFSIIKLVDLMISEAYNMRASDIHIEGAKNLTRIRYRVDGELSEVHTWPKKLQMNIITRLKVLTNMDITKHQVPQDGHFCLEIEDNEVDFRVAVSPTERGESCVIRILDQSKGSIKLDEIGFQEDDCKKIRKSLNFAQGFILVTGPTGSGKTTSLYAMLNEINSVKKKIITIEDPVEYRLDLINQIPVNHIVGLDFAKGLRSILRQDPDVVLVGEIRDRETANTAVQASLTGHLLLSTLHTNGTVETIFRLIDIGIEPFFVKEVINCVVAQRLVKLLCPYCKEEYEPERQELEDLGLEAIPEGKFFYRAGGCYFCNEKGYKGRSAIMEVLMGTDRVKQAIFEKATSSEIKKIAVEEGMRTFRDNALDKIYNGITTVEEVRKIIPITELEKSS